MERNIQAVRALESKDFIGMIKAGALNLKRHFQEVNDLNVFPVPDGDTGINMRRTIETGYDVIKDRINEKNIEPLYMVADDLAKGMLHGARGNSGVILSQIFRGFSYGLFQKRVVWAPGLAAAWNRAVKQAYQAVVKPVEGTILTVLREAVSFANRNLNVTISMYFENMLKQARITLAKTKEMLEVLKDANVVDSGGAGLVYIIEGFYNYFTGRNIDKDEEVELGIYDSNKEKTPVQDLDFSLFNEDSVLDYGYCTEFILQLQSSKVDVNTFNEQTIIDYLKTQGDSIVCFRDGSLVKAHVHTKDPGAILSHVRKWGEFLTLKIENMSLQHNNVEEHKTQIEEKAKEAEITKMEHKKFASIAVVNGEGIKNAFTELGVDRIIDGGQTMNPSSEDFIQCFDTIDAENIFVLPNNSNIIMAAEQAANLYMDIHSDVKIFVIKTKSVPQGYVAASMFSFDSEEANQIIEDVYSSINNISSLEITTATRNSTINSIKVTKNDYIAILNHNLVADNKDKITCLMDALKTVDGIEFKDLIFIIYGKDFSDEDKKNTELAVKNTYNNLEIGTIDGGQDIYDYMIAIS